MDLKGALSGQQKNDELAKKKNDIANELSNIIGIVSEGLGSQYDCYVDVKLEINIIPDGQ